MCLIWTPKYRTQKIKIIIKSKNIVHKILHMCTQFRTHKCTDFCFTLFFKPMGILFVSKAERKIIYVNIFRFNLKIKRNTFIGAPDKPQ